MNRKRLRERLEDIAAGAGVTWVEDDEYWDGGMCPEQLQPFMFAVRDRFDLGSCDITHISYIEEWSDLDRLTQRIAYLLDQKAKDE